MDLILGGVLECQPLPREHLWKDLPLERAEHALCVLLLLCPARKTTANELPNLIQFNLHVFLIAIFKTGYINSTKSHTGKPSK